MRNNIKGQTIKIPDLMISTCITSLFLKGQISMYVESISILTLKKDKIISTNFGKGYWPLVGLFTRIIDAV